MTRVWPRGTPRLPRLAGDCNGSGTRRAGVEVAAGEEADAEVDATGDVGAAAALE